MNFDWKVHYKNVRFRRVLEWFFIFHPEFVFPPAFFGNTAVSMCFDFKVFELGKNPYYSIVLVNFKFTVTTNVNLVIDTHRLPIRYDLTVYCARCIPRLPLYACPTFRVKLMRLHCVKINCINLPTLKIKQNNCHCDGRDRGKSQRKQDEKRSGGSGTASAAAVGYDRVGRSNEVLNEKNIKNARPSVRPCVTYILFFFVFTKRMYEIYWNSTIDNGTVPNLEKKKIKLQTRIDRKKSCKNKRKGIKKGLKSKEDQTDR